MPLRDTQQLVKILKADATLGMMPTELLEGRLKKDTGWYVVDDDDVMFLVYKASKFLLAFPLPK